MTFDPAKPFEKYINDAVVRDAVSTFFPTAEISAWRVIPKGWQNVSIHVVTDEEEVVLRFYSLEYLDAPRQQNDIIYGLEFMEYLYNHGIPVSKVFKTTGSEYVATVRLGDDHHYVAMLSYIPGAEASEYSDDLIKAVARVQARMHDLAEDYSPKRSLSTSGLFDLQAWFDSLKVSLPQEHQYQDTMAELEEYIQAALDRTTPEALSDIPRILIHGDMNRENFRFVDGELSGVFDFDDCHESVRSEDIGVFLSDCLSGLSRDAMLQRINTYFRAYRDIKETTPTDCLLALCFCVEKWVITQYFFCVNDILSGRPLDTPENIEYIQTTIQQARLLLDVIQSSD